MTSLPLTSPIAARAYLQRKMKAALAAGQGLSGLVDAYEAMCLRPIQGIPAAQDARLFETGTYSASIPRRRRRKPSTGCSGTLTGTRASF